LQAAVCRGAFSITGVKRPVKSGRNIYVLQHSRENDHHA